MNSRRVVWGAVALVCVVSMTTTACASSASQTGSTERPTSATRPGAFVYAVGIFDLIMRSSDGGATWSQVHCDSPRTALGALWSVRFADPRLGWTVGMYSILATKDRGLHWSSRYTGSVTLHLSDIACSGARQVWVVGHRYRPHSESSGDPSGTEAVILSTMNSGATWRVQTLPQLAWLRGVAFADPRHGWAVGEDRTQRYGVIVVTSDGGRHWRSQQRFEWTDFTAVTCTDAAHVWAVGGPTEYPASTLRPTPPMVVATSDGGVRWHTQLLADAKTSGDMNAVDFIDARHGWVVGSKTVFATSDGGVTWRARPPDAGPATSKSTYYSVSFADAQHGWIVVNHRQLLTTSDGGRKWQLALCLPIGRSVTSVAAFGPRN